MPQVEVIGLKELDRIMKKTGRKMETVALELGQDLGEAFVEATPVITGNLRNHWYTSLNTPNAPSALAAFTGGTRSSAEVSDYMTLGLVGFKEGDAIYFVNGADYAMYVEYGTSKMAPRAFVRGVLSRLDSIANATIRRIARK